MENEFLITLNLIFINNLKLKFELKFEATHACEAAIYRAFRMTLIPAV